LESFMATEGLLMIRELMKSVLIFAILFVGLFLLYGAAVL